MKIKNYNLQFLLIVIYVYLHFKINAQPGLDSIYNTYGVQTIIQNMNHICLFWKGIENHKIQIIFLGLKSSPGSGPCCSI